LEYPRRPTLPVFFEKGTGHCQYNGNCGIFVNEMGCKKWNRREKVVLPEVTGGVSESAIKNAVLEGIQK